ncbi:ATP-binding protein [Sedimenticola selenatireducens]|uniref:Sensor protein n=1 Tax=Sedimenticola selenatireducens TaxID=191960 RepID=A0A557SDP9_9GAMM|nr:ATP-binding protein [Sedimenticola selenatireducens]TVO75481.1 histidine kinase [Sedimenticola selenatireducens]TVT65387.1 MAG: histidine kinase [Sedimenticola selenatireducens]
MSNALTNDEKLTRSAAPEAGGLLLTIAGRYPYLQVLVAARLIGPLVTLAFVLLFNLILVFLFVRGGDAGVIGILFLLSSLVAIASFALGVNRLRNRLLAPLVQLERAVGDVCQGEPWTTLVFDDVGVLGPLARDLDSLSSELIDLYEDMDNRVARQTRRLAQQTTGLKALYDVAASINQIDDMDDLLMRFLRILKEMAHGVTATVQLTTPEGLMRLVGSLGPDDQLLTESEQLPVSLCQCGKALSSGDVLCEHDAEACSRRNGRHMYSSDELEQVTVPLKFHGNVLGLYRIYIRKPALEGREEMFDLLSTIGSHLGIAIAKHRSDEEARRLSIIEERTALAHELHDSLAQTLASLRFQVRMLDETLEQETVDPSPARSELERIKNGLDEAHTELRELLNSFLAPVDQRGLIIALEKMAQRFKQDTGVSIFFQSGCRQVNMGASEEMQLLRIVQESLANIRKHAKAHTVRVLLTCNPEGEYRLLVEDDGVGFDNVRPPGNPGEHIGLSIMEERARRVGAEIKIESELGEGTRVELTYNPGISPRKSEKKETH